MVKANDFFELSHGARQKMLELALEGPRKHSEFLKVLKIAPAEVTRHLRRLTEAGLLTKDSESGFSATPYGRLSLQELEILESVNQNKKFFDTRDFSVIPKEFLSMSLITESELLQGPMRVFEKLYQITVEADEFIWCTLQAPTDPFIIEHAQQLSRGLELRLIFQEGNRVPTEYSDHRMMPLEIREMPEVPISVAISEKEAIVILQDVNRKLGYSYGLTGTDEEFLRWCWLLFEHFWVLGNEIIL